MVGITSIREQRLKISEHSSPRGSVGRIANIAQERAETIGAMYAKRNSPTSPHPLITGNAAPEESKLTWLKNRSKCNQFVGDVLTLAGYQMPMFRMPDGSFHYRNAEMLPKADNHFRRIKGFADARTGDIVFIDYPKKKGEDGAHVEIITRIDCERGLLMLTGARNEGAAERDASALLHNLQPVQILRPIRLASGR